MITGQLTTLILVQLHLPPRDNVNKDFLKKILKNEKRLLKLSEVNHIKVPLFEELNVAKLYEHYKSNPLLEPYLPDRYAKGRQIDRTFFFNIFNTILPEVLKKIVDNAYAQRE